MANASELRDEAALPDLNTAFLSRQAGKDPVPDLDQLGPVIPHSDVGRRGWHWSVPVLGVAASRAAGQHVWREQACFHGVKLCTCQLVVYHLPAASRNG